MKEKIVIIFVALVSGLLLTTVVFYIYQTSKNIPQNISPKKNTALNTSTQKSKVLLTIDEPTNEAISANRTISVKGKTNPENTVIVSTNQEDIVVSPSSEGNFSITIDIDTGVNKLIIRSITPSGEEKTEERIITFSTEEF